MYCLQSSLAFAENPEELLQAALFDEKEPAVLKPKTPALYQDKSYILYALGLLGQSRPAKAAGLARKYLERVA